MKSYNELTPEQQAKALNKCQGQLLESIIEGAIRFDDKLNHDNLQARLEAAMQKANDNRTPWFAHEFIMEDSFCAERIRGMAQCDVEEAIYSESHERVISGIAD